MVQPVWWVTLAIDNTQEKQFTCTRYASRLLLSLHGLSFLLVALPMLDLTVLRTIPNFLAITTSLQGFDSITTLCTTLHGFFEAFNAKTRLCGHQRPCKHCVKHDSMVIELDWTTHPWPNAVYCRLFDLMDDLLDFWLLWILNVFIKKLGKGITALSMNKKEVAWMS
jgi:hypothetical protein